MKPEVTYEQYRERLHDWVKKNAQRKVMRARRTERERVRQLGGGKRIAEVVMKPAAQRKP